MLPILCSARCAQGKYIGSNYSRLFSLSAIRRQKPRFSGAHDVCNARRKLEFILLLLARIAGI